MGTHFPSNGSNKNNISYFRKKAELWADRIRTNKLSVHDAWTALKTTITRTLEYPLTASTMRKKECDWIMSPAIQQGLKSSRIQSKMPRALVYGPETAQGLNIPSLHIIQTVSHIEIIQKHMSTSSITGKLLKSLMEKHQLECGSKTNFFELNPNSWSKLLTKTWLSTTWQDMWTYKTNLQLKNNILPQ